MYCVAIFHQNYQVHFNFLTLILTTKFVGSKCFFCCCLFVSLQHIICIFQQYFPYVCWQWRQTGQGTDDIWNGCRTECPHTTTVSVRGTCMFLVWNSHENQPCQWWILHISLYGSFNLPSPAQKIPVNRSFLLSIPTKQLIWISLTYLVLVCL